VSYHTANIIILTAVLLNIFVDIFFPELNECRKSRIYCICIFRLLYLYKCHIL